MTLKIAIVGAGFSGTALVSMLSQFADQPVEIFLFDKSGQFGPGIAYSTDNSCHLLNVPAKNMSANDDENHFLNWLNQSQQAKPYLHQHEPIADQFVPRFLYGEYLKQLLHADNLSTSIKLFKIQEEVRKVTVYPDKLDIITHHSSFNVNKVVLATGNELPDKPSFLSSEQNYIENPWSALSLKKISKEDSVLLLGSGLTMIDTLISLAQQNHRGKIYALSRHGLLPLAHQKTHLHYELPEQFPRELKSLFKFLRQECSHENHSWQDVIQHFRQHIPILWKTFSLAEKTRFLRHGATYWNIHRHRIATPVLELFLKLSKQVSFEMLKGRIVSFENEIATIRLRGATHFIDYPVKWLINCTGPALHLKINSLMSSLIHQGAARVDDCHIGLCVNEWGAIVSPYGQVSNSIFTIGSLRKGSIWESTAVPELRHQAMTLTKYLLNE